VKNRLDFIKLCKTLEFYTSSAPPAGIEPISGWLVFYSPNVLAQTGDVAQSIALLVKTDVSAPSSAKLCPALEFLSTALQN